MKTTLTRGGMLQRGVLKSVEVEDWRPRSPLETRDPAVSAPARRDLPLNLRAAHFTYEGASLCS